MNLRVEKFGNRMICIGGVGTLFHQEGFPLGMSASRLAEQGIELSWLHVAKELYFQYTSNDRLFNKLKSEIEDAKIDGVIANIDLVRKFCYRDYDTQQSMIFEFLFNSNKASAINWIKETFVA